MLSFKTWLRSPIPNKVPQITLFFWVVKLLSTGMGEDLSDYLVRTIGPFPAVGLGLLVFALSLLTQFVARGFSSAKYWFTVVMVSVFGTMAADIAHIGLGVPYLAATIFFSVALAIIFWLWHRLEGSLSIKELRNRRREVFYWLTVLCTFALGTAAGDLTARSLAWGYLNSALIFTGLMLIPLAGFVRLGQKSVLAFWAAYVITRPVGASFADYFAADTHLGGLGLGFGQVSAVLTLIIVILVASDEVRRRHISRATAN